MKWRHSIIIALLGCKTCILSPVKELVTEDCQIIIIKCIRREITNMLIIRLLSQQQNSASARNGNLCNEKHPRDSIFFFLNLRQNHQAMTMSLSLPALILTLWHIPCKVPSQVPTELQKLRGGVQWSPVSYCKITLRRFVQN